MPRIKTNRRKPPPEGYEFIQETIDDLNRKMREVENESHEGRRKGEAMWPIFRIHHQRSRYVFDMFWKRKAISRELYDWCLKEGIADGNLIAKWRKQGYEKLCCLRCIQSKDTDYGNTCICRVPREKMDEDKFVECVNCGCRGCSSGGG